MNVQQSSSIVQYYMGGLPFLVGSHLDCQLNGLLLQEPILAAMLGEDALC